MRNNVFQIYSELGKVPFAVSRANWLDSDFAVITEVIPKGEYGIAYGFPVRDGVPNEHFSYDRKWREEMRMPSAGCYQWRLIPVPEADLHRLVRRFDSTVAGLFEFGRKPLQFEEEFL